MPSRRAVLVALVCGVAGCSGSGDDGGPSQVTPTASPTPEPVTVSRTASATVPDEATVAVFPAIAQSLRAAAGETPAAVTSTAWADPLRTLGCFSFDSTAYTVTATQRGGGYVNEYRVSPAAQPQNASTVRVSGLPDGTRGDVIAAIEAGEYRYESDTGGFQPNGSVYRYQNTSYEFRLEVHADKPVTEEFTLERTASEECVTLESMSLDADQRDALDAVLAADDGGRVSMSVARALNAAGVDYILRRGAFYRVDRPTADSTASTDHRGGV